MPARFTVQDHLTLDEDLGSEGKHLGGVRVADVMVVNDDVGRVIAARRDDEDPASTPLVRDGCRHTGNRPEQQDLLQRHVTCGRRQQAGPMGHWVGQEAEEC